MNVNWIATGNSSFITFTTFMHEMSESHQMQPFSALFLLLCSPLRIKWLKKIPFSTSHKHFNCVGFFLLTATIKTFHFKLIQTNFMQLMNNYFRFLLHCLEDLDHSLRRINSRLFVVRGQPTDVLPKLFDEWGLCFFVHFSSIFSHHSRHVIKACRWYFIGTTCLTFEEDPEPFGKARDESIIQLCRESNVEVIQVVSHTLYKLEK